MELLEGQALRQRLANGALPVPKTLDFALHIAQGLAAVHKKGSSAYASLRDDSGGRPPRERERRRVSLTFISWNRIERWPRQLDRLRTVA